MIVPGLYGYVSATKWVTKLTLTTFARQKARAAAPPPGTRPR